MRGKERRWDEAVEEMRGELVAVGIEAIVTAAVVAAAEGGNCYWRCCCCSCWKFCCWKFLVRVQLSQLRRPSNRSSCNGRTSSCYVAISTRHDNQTDTIACFILNRLQYVSPTQKTAPPARHPLKECRVRGLAGAGPSNLGEALNSPI